MLLIAGIFYLSLLILFYIYAGYPFNVVFNKGASRYVINTDY